MGIYMYACCVSTSVCMYIGTYYMYTCMYVYMHASV